MSRSKYVYIGYNHADELIGAWTVKYELVAYAKDSMGCHRDYRISRAIRTKDGTGAGCVGHKVDDITDDILREST